MDVVRAKYCLGVFGFFLSRHFEDWIPPTNESSVCTSHDLQTSLHSACLCCYIFYSHHSAIDWNDSTLGRIFQRH